ILEFDDQLASPCLGRRIALTLIRVQNRASARWQTSGVRGLASGHSRAGTSYNSNLMILTCPACDSRFSLDDSAFRAHGRRVRCGQCRHIGHAPPPPLEVEEGYEPPEPAEVRIASSVDEAPIRATLPSSRVAPAPRRRSRAGLAWAALVLIVILVVG